MLPLIGVIGGMGLGLLERTRGETGEWPLTLRIAAIGAAMAAVVTVLPVL